jgi:hypothetical protein
MPRKKRIYNGVGMIGSPPDFRVDQEGDIGLSLVNQLNIHSQSLVKKINGKISWGNGQPGSNAGNMDAIWIDFITPSVGDTQFAVYHPLGRVPIGVGVLRQDQAGILYDLNSGGWNAEKIYFGCDTASVTFRILVV